jgi:hypothetical protein
MSLKLSIKPSETKLEKEEDEKDHELDEFCSIEEEDFKSTKEEEQGLNVPDNVGQYMLSRILSRTRIITIIIDQKRL